MSTNFQSNQWQSGRFDMRALLVLMIGLLLLASLVALPMALQPFSNLLSPSTDGPVLQLEASCSPFAALNPCVSAANPDSM